jgi:hypothetical protein
MAIEISVCALLACPRTEPSAWQTRFSWIDVAEPDAQVAKEFIELQVDTEGFGVGETDTDVLVATVHPGHVPYNPLITHADMEVPDGQEDRWSLETWTVCGIFADNGQCYSAPWAAYGPLAAYGTAWNHWRREGRELWVAGVHPGDEVRTLWTPTFADPTCTTVEAMASRLAELIPGRATS